MSSLKTLNILLLKSLRCLSVNDCFKDYPPTTTAIVERAYLTLLWTLNTDSRSIGEWPLAASKDYFKATHDGEPFYFPLCYLSFAGWWKGISLTFGWDLRVTRTALDEQLKLHFASFLGIPRIRRNLNTAHSIIWVPFLGVDRSAFRITVGIVGAEAAGARSIRTEAGTKVLLRPFFLPLWRNWMDCFWTLKGHWLSQLLLGFSFESSTLTPVSTLPLKARTKFALTANI
jgi:hypothetical protein